ncbi:hypothetical protein PR048_021852 [Dryococelus australis]|uniref:Uncharacterized protein n=1 Tax=Dryococelus australis TaxID=614101 RepID=A0ABQ9GZD4_9NEOP|nr:hypothetical protein PR048_021852 [Dryococelus australis]
MQLYKFYKDDWCTNRGVEPLSACTFSQVFGEQSVSLYRPKKDECDLCAAFKFGNLSQDQCDIHLQEKERQERKNYSDKVNEECVYTMDLQSLLLCTRSNFSRLYYKTKLAVHNFTIFDLKSHDVYRFIWNETEEGLKANEFSTIITSFVRSQLPLPDHANKLILCSFGCCYQNRNTTLSNDFCARDTPKWRWTHGMLQLKHKTINVPADYVHACRSARNNPHPYGVKYVNHEYFKQFNQHLLYTTIRPGRKAGEPTVTDLRTLRYCPDGNIFYKLRFSEN